MKQNVFVLVIVIGYWIMLNDVECETFNLFVMQISRHLFVISFQEMFHKTLRYRLSRAFNTPTLDEFSGEHDRPHLKWFALCCNWAGSYLC